MYRAEVSVILEGKRRATCLLICPPSMCEERLENEVELLSILVEHAVMRRQAARSCLPRSKAEPDGDEPTPGTRLSLVRAALAYIDAHLGDERLRVEGVARHLGVNASYLAHVFRERTGQRMSRYITLRRLRQAKLLIANTAWQIKRIAHECGLRDANWFSHLFRLETGHTPTAYRRFVRRIRRTDGPENKRFSSS